MSTPSRSAPPNNSRSLDSTSPLLVRYQLARGMDPGSRLMVRLMPAWIISGGIHVLLIFLFLMATYPSSTSETPRRRPSSRPR